MFYRLKKKLQNQYIKLLISRILGKKQFYPEQSLLIFSDPRGGSTWLTRIINKVPNTAVVWEPLHLGEAFCFRELNFGWRQYIPEDTVWPEAKVAFKNLLQGKLVNAYSVSFSSSKDFSRANQLIIKFCRGNALLPWLVHQFNFTYQPIYLVRHPFAVVASQMKQGGWDQKFNGFEFPDSPFNDIYIQHKDFLSTLSTKEECLTATWCITNKLVLDNPGNNKKWITVYYENLLLNPSPELNRIFSRWNMEMPNYLLKEIREPSGTSSRGNPVEKELIQLSKWQEQFSAGTIRKLERVLSYFSISQYGSDIFPLISDAE